MMTAVEGMYGGLQGLADILQVERIGPMHQAGSDSMLTSVTFFALLEKHMGGIADESRSELFHISLLFYFTFRSMNRFRGELFGLGNNHTKYRVKGFSGQSSGAQSGGGMIITMSGGGGGQTMHHSTSRESVSGIHHSRSNEILSQQGTNVGGMMHYSSGVQMYNTGYSGDNGIQEYSNPRHS